MFYQQLLTNDVCSDHQKMVPLAKSLLLPKTGVRHGYWCLILELIHHFENIPAFANATHIFKIFDTKAILACYD